MILMNRHLTQELHWASSATCTILSSITVSPQSHSMSWKESHNHSWFACKASRRMSIFFFFLNLPFFKAKCLPSLTHPRHSLSLGKNLLSPRLNFVFYFSKSTFAIYLERGRLTSVDKHKPVCVFNFPKVYSGFLLIVVSQRTYTKNK